MIAPSQAAIADVRRVTLIHIAKSVYEKTVASCREVRRPGLH